MNINYQRNASSTDPLLVNTKAVLMEARLQRLSYVSGYKNHNAAYISSTRRAKNISNENIDVNNDERKGSVCSRNSRRQSKSRSLFSSAEVTLDVDDILQELKQVKRTIMKDIKGRRINTSLTDTEMNSIQNFMKACDLMLESFEVHPRHEAGLYFERYSNNRQQNKRRQRSSSVKFDLSRNEFFSY